MTAKTRILCIEDHRETAALIAEELAERGLEVIFAHDGSERFAGILKTMPDLILSDISMRDMSGFEVLQNLAKIAPHFVTKPIDFDILATIIAARLGQVARTHVWVRKSSMTGRSKR
jgi:CheY-like chemotaxis protein